MKNVLSKFVMALRAESLLLICYKYTSVREISYLGSLDFLVINKEWTVERVYLKVHRLWMDKHLI